MPVRVRSWRDPRDEKRWDVELHTSRREGEEWKAPAFWLLFRRDRTRACFPWRNPTNRLDRRVYGR